MKNDNDSKDNQITMGTFYQKALSIIFGFIIFGFTPGLFITSIIDWFVGLEQNPAWGFTIINTLLVYVLCRKYKYHFTNFSTTISYAIISTSLAFLIFLSLLFWGPLFPYRTLNRMFGNEIVDEWETSPGEQKMIRQKLKPELLKEISKTESEISDIEITVNQARLKDKDAYIPEEVTLEWRKEKLIYYKKQLDSLNNGLTIKDIGLWDLPNL